MALLCEVAAGELSLVVDLGNNCCSSDIDGSISPLPGAILPSKLGVVLDRWSADVPISDRQTCLYVPAPGSLSLALLVLSVVMSQTVYFY